MKAYILKNLWKPADGDGLPEYEREVIVLIQPYPLEGTEYAVSFAHRPAADKVESKQEPKFKTGTYVVYLNDTYMLEDDGKHYILTAIKKNTSTPVIHIPYGDEDYTMRKWTIQDAKDGDVLATENFIFIFKNIDNGNGVHYYCHYEISKHEDDNQFGIALPQSLMGIVGNNISHYSPATKEQRDQLKKAMADAGYTFDFDKKELKKIEQKPAENKGMNLSEEDMTPFQKKVFCIIDTAIEEEQGLKQVCDELLRLAHDEIKQKPAWSEEDEHRVKDTIYFLDTAKKHYASTVELDACIDWIKSLRPQNTWKPSDEQMNLLEELMEDNNQRYFYTILRSLYQDLKKLREE